MQAHTKIGCAAIETGDTTMFTKSTIALALILGITSGALAATAQRQHRPDPASGAFAATTQRQDGPPVQTWQDPNRPMQTWDAYGMRWD
jgi:hypothetical protein